jgi:hypothetical protein
MTTYFFGGALGTALGVIAYDRYGWGDACAWRLASAVSRCSGGWPRTGTSPP